MAFVLRFSPDGMTADKYDECINKLKAAGAGAPKGRSYHVAYGGANGIKVIDVWDSMEDFDAFGKILIPILQSLGIDPGNPKVKEVHNIIRG